MSIWFQPIDLALLTKVHRDTLASQIGIEFTAFGDDWLSATMPVDGRTHQPFGILHGGASVALAETLGSMGGHLCVDGAKFMCVGQAITANHIRSVREGLVTGTARPVHIGGRSHVWQIEIRDTAAHLICLSTLTLAVLTKR